MSAAAAQAQSLLVQQTSSQRQDVIGLYRRCLRCAASIKDAGWRSSYLEYTRDSFRRSCRLPYHSHQATDARNYAEEQVERMKYYISLSQQMQKDRKEVLDKKVFAEDSPHSSLLRPLSSLLPTTTTSSESSADKVSRDDPIKEIDSSSEPSYVVKAEELKVSPSVSSEAASRQANGDSPMNEADSSSKLSHGAESLQVYSHFRKDTATTKDESTVNKDVSSQQASEENPEEVKRKLLMDLLSPKNLAESEVDDVEKLNYSKVKNVLLDLLSSDLSIKGQKKLVTTSTSGDKVAVDNGARIHSNNDTLSAVFDRIKQNNEEQTMRTDDSVATLVNFFDRMKQNMLPEERSSTPRTSTASAKGGRRRKKKLLSNIHKKTAVSEEKKKSGPKVVLKTLDTASAIDDIISADIQRQSKITNEKSKAASAAIDNTTVSQHILKENAVTKLIETTDNNEKADDVSDTSHIKEHTVESFLKEAVPFLYPGDIQSYTKRLVEDGFDSVQIIVNELLREDLDFMKKAHSRAFWNFIQTKKK